MSENTTIAIILTSCAFAFAWCVWVIAVNIRRSRSNKQITALHSHLLDRFSANQDLIAFLEGESGRRYFEALETDLKEPLSRLLNGLQFGILLVLLGLSLLAVRTSQTTEPARQTLLLIGVPAIALGAGFLISALISQHLCKSWGLLERNKRQAP